MEGWDCGRPMKGFGYWWRWQRCVVVWIHCRFHQLVLLSSSTGGRKDGRRWEVVVIDSRWHKLGVCLGKLTLLSSSSRMVRIRIVGDSIMTTCKKWRMRQSWWAMMPRRKCPESMEGRFENKRGSVVNGYTLGKLLEEETSGAMSPSSLLPSRRRRHESSLKNGSNSNI